MQPKIVRAKNNEVMYELKELFIKAKYNVYAEEGNFVLLRRNYYGNYVLHAIFLLIALFLNAWALIINLIIFSYSYFNKSNIILITTETLDEEGNPLEFDDVGDIQVFYSQEDWDRAIELSKLE